MISTNAAHPADPSHVSQRHVRLIRRQRLTVFVLLVSLVAAVLYARSAVQRADRYRQDLLRLRSQRQPEPVSSASASDYYPATLIGEDGAPTPLEGRALHVDLGGERLLEIDLTRQETGWLYMWSPAHREDTDYNRVVFHPHCSNAYSLELDRVALRSEVGGAGDTAEATVATTTVTARAADSVRYQQPH